MFLYENDSSMMCRCGSKAISWEQPMCTFLNASYRFGSFALFLCTDAMWLATHACMWSNLPNLDVQLMDPHRAYHETVEEWNRLAHELKEDEREAEHESGDATGGFMGMDM